MRWSTLVLSVTLFYSLSFVNAIPHDAYEKRHWLHKRQTDDNGSITPVPATVSKNPQANSSPPVASPSPPTNTPKPSPSPSPSSSTSTPRLPTSTPQQPSESSSTTISDPSSSSSSSSSSSRTGTTTSPSSPPTVTNRPDNNQSPTSYRHISSTRSLPSDTNTADGNVETGTGSGTSFLKNKAAAGTTFAIVGLIGAAIIAGVIFYMMKKARQRRDEDELDTYFEKLPAKNSSGANNPNTGSGNDFGLGPSATDLTTPANAQTYMSRDVHYGGTDQYPSQYPNYNGFEYPPDRTSVAERPVSFAPGTAYASAMSQQGPYNYGVQAEDPNMVPNHPFADPENRRY